MKLVLNFIFLVILAPAWAQELVDTRQREIVFSSVNVIPMDRERVLENQDVVIKNGKIAALGESKKVKYDKSALVIDAKGKYLIPGLAEMHAHVPPVDDLAPMKEVLILYAANGITTIRGMLGHPRHLELRSKIQSGEILGPRLYTSGPSLNGTSVKTAEGGAAMVREQKAAGYDFLKLHPGLTLDNFNAIVKTAKEVNIPFAGHVSWDVGIWRAIDAGYASIDHLDGFIEGMVPGIETLTQEQVGFVGLYVAGRADATQIPKLVKGLRDHHIWAVPTQALAERWLSADKTSEQLRNAPEMIYMDPKTVANWADSKDKAMSSPLYKKEDFDSFIRLRRKLIYECNKNGVGLLLGSDAPQVFNVPGFSIHHELQYIVDSGLTPYEALRTGTVNVAAYFNRPDAGIIKAGNVADLVLLAGDPLADIKQTRGIEGVMLANRWLSKEYIAIELNKLVKQ